MEAGEKRVCLTMTASNQMLMDVVCIQLAGEIPLSTLLSDFSHSAYRSEQHKYKHVWLALVY